ncbi:hypothetical protein ACFY2H_00430 [Streptomyces griseofuscus]|uniref:hypothetical protein n=1 Tax=Streptomyces griseofuscus TaxID=146922 RepID=UPI0036930144
MTNTAQVHDGTEWRTPSSYEVFDGTGWKGVSKQEVYDGAKWVEVFTDKPVQPLKKPGAPANLQLRQLNRADGTFAIRASWEKPASGDTEWYEYQWVTPASGSWTANGNTKTDATNVEITLKQPINWDGAFAFRVAAYNRDFPGGGAWASTSGAHFPLTKPADKIPAPAEVQVWREGGAWNEVHVFWTPVPGHNDYTIRVWHEGKVVNTVDTNGLPGNDAGYRQKHVAPVPTPQWGQVFEYEVSVKGADSWSGRVEHKWAGYSVGAPGKPKVAIRQVWWPEDQKGNHLDIEWVAPSADPDHAFYRVEWFATGSNGTQTSGSINTTSAKTSLHLTDAVVGPVKGSNVSFKALAHSTNEDHSEDFATSVESDMTTPTWLA